MANRNTQGFGLRPVSTLGDTPSTQGQSKYTIEAAYATTIFNGEPVILDRGGVTDAGGFITTGCASTTNAVCGVLNGVFYNASSTLKPTWANGYAGAITPANSENITAFVNDNPFQEYDVVLAGIMGASQNAQQAKIGLVADVASTAGSSINLKSSTTLGTPATSGLGWAIVRKGEDPDNSDFAATFSTVVVVQNLKYNSWVAGIA